LGPAIAHLLGLAIGAGDEACVLDLGGQQLGCKAQLEVGSDDKVVFDVGQEASRGPCPQRTEVGDGRLVVGSSIADVDLDATRCPDPAVE